MFNFRLDKFVFVIEHTFYVQDDPTLVVKMEINNKIVHIECIEDLKLIKENITNRHNCKKAI